VNYLATWTECTADSLNSRVLYSFCTFRLKLQIQSVFFTSVNKCVLSNSVKCSSMKSFIFVCHLEMWVIFELKLVSTCFAAYKWSENCKEGRQTVYQTVIPHASTNLLIVLHWFLWGTLYTIQQFVQHKLYKPVDSVRSGLTCCTTVCWDCVSLINKRYVHFRLSGEVVMAKIWHFLQPLHPHFLFLFPFSSWITLWNTGSDDYSTLRCRRISMTTAVKHLMFKPVA